MARLELVETSLRQGQQALLVSRLRTRHAIPVAQHLDTCGFTALEVFGGKTFEAQLRFLGENPFDRLRAIREVVSQTPLQATITGQSLVAHRQMPDDVVDAFVTLISDAGIDILRIFDPLNDVRNFERPLAQAKAAGRIVECEIIASAAPGEMDRLITLAQGLAERGADRIAICDPLGVLTIERASQLTQKIVAQTSLPVTLSFSSQTGQADAAYVAGVLAGAGRLDVALSPLAGGASLPAAEAVVASFAGGDHDTNIDLEKVAEAALTLETALLHYGEVADTLAMRLDTSALRGLLPPSAMGHALVELRDRGALDRLGDVEKEVGRVRAELGHPPLVSPMTEIIATQAVYNVCDGDRYATVSQEVKDYCLNFYGSPPTPIAGDILRIINGREEPITLRPADLLEPALPPAKKTLKRDKLDTSTELLVLCALFPAEWLAVARGEADVELLGDEDPQEVPSESAPTDVDADAALDVLEQPPVEPATPQLETREMSVEVDGQNYTVKVSAVPGTFGAGSGATVSAAASSEAVVRPGTVVAPMQGLILKLPVAVGQTVGLGDAVAVLEAMKMQNDVVATKAGTVTEIHVVEGDVVSPGDPIVHIG